MDELLEILKVRAERNAKNGGVVRRENNGVGDDEHVNSVLNKIRRYINALSEISLRVRIFRFCPNFILITALPPALFAHALQHCLNYPCAS